MKFLIFICASVVAVSTFPDETYDSAYDSFDAKELIQSPRLLRHYGNCFLDKGPCTPEGLDFKDIMAEAWRTSCAKCTRKQRELIRTVSVAFRTQHPQISKELEQKLDPKGVYTKSFNKFLDGTD